MKAWSVAVSLALAAAAFPRAAWAGVARVNLQVPQAGAGAGAVSGVAGAVARPGASFSAPATRLDAASLTRVAIPQLPASLIVRDLSVAAPDAPSILVAGPVFSGAVMTAPADAPRLPGTPAGPASESPAAGADASAAAGED
ncbi:MAG: hypothetical protein SF051_04155, partial [Elusimicrobiota bacterium]|nr:hypothetical protein [Elusimicrobiota bacterium]